eukprot:2125665-Alexandrium_andersonii.AAC.1
MRARALALRARAVSAPGRGTPPRRTPSPLSSQRCLAGRPPGSSGSGRRGGLLAVPQATVGGFGEAPMRQRGGGSAT